MARASILSSGEVAAALGIPRDSLHAAMRAGLAAPAVRLAGRFAWMPADVQRARDHFASRRRVKESGINV